jgi:hypothetical protein
MDSFALTLFAVCACGAMICVALLQRWLRTHSRKQPDIVLDSLPPAARIVAPSPAGRSVGAAGAVGAGSLAIAQVVPDDEPTRPMTRTDTAFGRTDFPSTLALDALDAESPPGASPGFADTMPLPVETVEGA